MKSILVIGIGRFGQHLCENLTKHDNQTMTVDISEEKPESVLSYVVSAKIGDCTSETVLKSLGVGNFDVCLIRIGNNFQNSLEVTSLIKEMGAKYVVSKANRDIHVRLLLKNGAGEMVYSDRDAAGKVTVRCSANNVFDYMELADGISIYEVKPLPQQVGKSIRGSGIRRLYGTLVIVVKSPDGHMRFMPGASHIIAGDTHLMMAGRQENAEGVVRHFTKSV